MILNIIVLIFEVLYYSLFMKFARPEGKLWRYILLFTIVTIITGICDVNYLLSYIVIISTMLYGIKYIVRLSISLYDLLFIIIMIFFKLVIEILGISILYNLLDMSLVYIGFQFLKILFVLIVKNRLNTMYNFLKKLWNNNNFYIRYLFSIFLFLYFIFSMIYLIIF